VNLLALIRPSNQGDPGQVAWEEMKVSLDDKGLVIRTDFSDQMAWVEVQARLKAGLEELGNAYTGSIENGDLGMLVVDDASYEGWTADQAACLVEEHNDLHAIFLADTATMNSEDKLLLAVGSEEEALGNWGEDGRWKWKFRIRPWTVTNVHLSLSGDVGFSEHFESVDDNGVYPF
jgi:hypothetical protein